MIISKTEVVANFLSSARPRISDVWHILSYYDRHRQKGGIVRNIFLYGAKQGIHVIVTEDKMINTLTSVVAQLRHAYTHLAAEQVTDQKQLAKGLISPQIQRLEQLILDLADGKTKP